MTAKKYVAGQNIKSELFMPVLVIFGPTVNFSQAGKWYVKCVTLFCGPDTRFPGWFVGQCQTDYRGWLKTQPWFWASLTVLFKSFLYNCTPLHQDTNVMQNALLSPKGEILKAPKLKNWSLIRNGIKNIDFLTVTTFQFASQEDLIIDNILTILIPIHAYQRLSNLILKHTRT